MAGGSSSPELFISLIGITIYTHVKISFELFRLLNVGIFFEKGDVGVGTIVGSAVFNVVCVIGICGLFVNGVSLDIK